MVGDLFYMLALTRYLGVRKSVFFPYDTTSLGPFFDGRDDRLAAPAKTFGY